MTAAMTTSGTAILSATSIEKSFLGVQVLKGVSLDLYPGRVHGLVGENGAGKSTLMKILAGVYSPDSGEMTLNGTAISYSHPIQAMKAGVATVFQEFNLLPDCSVAENVFLGREPRTHGMVDNLGMERAAAALLEELGIDFIDPHARVRTLSVAEQQIVEITKALSFDARVISMDEPTASLADNEVELLYGIIEKLRSRGVAILYVSHRLKEIFDLCDSITVLKDGALVSSTPAVELTTNELVRRMVGRSISTYFPHRLDGTTTGDTRLAIRGGGNDYIADIDLELRAGEIVGVAGLQGSGRTELAEAIFGAVPFTRGSLELDGTPVTVKSPRRAVKEGIALITEDRKARGLALGQSVLDNTLMVIHGVFASRTGEARQAIPGVLSSLEISSRGLVGLVNGLVTTMLKVPSFIVTLGMMLALLGGVLYWTGGAATGNPADGFRQIGRGGIRDVPIFDIIPWSVIILAIVLTAAIWFSKRPFGRTLIAVGDNVTMARYAGVRVWWVKTSAFMISSLSATIAGVLLVGYAGVHPSVGRGYEFIAITAVVLGGVVLGGGRGWVVAAVAGAFALEALFTLLNFTGVPSTLRDAIQGVIIILAVAYSGTTLWSRAKTRTPPPSPFQGKEPDRERDSAPPAQSSPAAGTTHTTRGGL